MSTTRMQSHVAPAVIALLLLFQVSPVAAGPSGRDGDEDRGGVEITYTKWITTPLPAPSCCLMVGFVDNGPVGSFVGEVLGRQVSADGTITRLEAMYEVADGERSFTALIRGGTDNVAGAALLDGVILAGWRTGARVHVEFQVMTNCSGAPAGRCFQGTIRIGPHGDD
jgi:hypothetical protein